MSDKLVFDLAQEVEGTPNVFVRKDWINILDNQNQNYNNNQSVIDTSQLSNSNKYMSYREAYFSIPMVLTLGAAARDMVAQVGADAVGAAIVAPVGPTSAQQLYFTPATSADGAPATTAGGKGADYAIGLKNWFGQLIHSFTLDYNGSTIIQQTPFVNMWNTFKLLTSLSYQDVLTQGPTIGFYPDGATSSTFCQGAAGFTTPANAVIAVQSSPAGQGTCNNTNYMKILPVFQPVAGTVETAANLAVSLNSLDSGNGNRGFLSRQKYINFDGQGQTQGQVASSVGGLVAYTAPVLPLGSFYQGGIAQLNQLWKSYIYTRVNQTAAANGVWQCAIMATVYLKHVHSFFNMCPLLKGVFMKMTMNLNNATTNFTCTSTYSGGAAGSTGTGLVPTSMTVQNVQVPVGGVNPVLIASGASTISNPANIVGGGAANAATVFGTYTSVVLSESNGGAALFPKCTQSAVFAAAAVAPQLVSNIYVANISVGATCLSPIPGAIPASLAKSVYLYIPAYTFNPVFEQAYLSSPVKQIKYTDIYQYQVLNVTPQNQFNNLITNGIANIKSVLIIPMFSAGTAGANGLNNIPCFQSPFDTAGCGTTSPYVSLTNFNIQVSGQNAIYNVQRYNFEEWNNQLYGQNAVNGGLTDGLTSGLIDRAGFDASYGYYYVNVERMLPVEQSVPKSIQILGLNASSRAVDLYVFVEYGVDISIDAITGARV